MGYSLVSYFLTHSVKKADQTFCLDLFYMVTEMFVSMESHSIMLLSILLFGIHTYI